MPADRPSATQPASLGSAAADAAPSPELLEWLAELDGDEDPMTQLDILASDSAPLPGAEATDDD
ncbi:MAG: hypothetical protein KDG52_09455 [Rhodocyclaceae bacterium]|nr:hypothetical protein [Rhodocyclaceae bacterium]